MLKKILTLLFSVSVPLGLHWLLKGSSSVIPPAVLSVLIPLSFITRKKYIILPILLAGAFYTFGSLVITPFSLIKAWLGMVAAGSGQGGISSVFTGVITFYTSLFAGLFLLRGRKALFYLLVILLFFTGLFTGDYRFFILMGAAFFLGGIIPALQHRSRRALTGYLLLLLAAGITAWVPVKIKDGKGSLAVDSLSGGLRHFILDNFPGFPLKTGIPGYGYGFTSKRSEMGYPPVLTPEVLFKVTARPRQVIYLRSEVMVFPWGGRYPEEDVFAEQGEGYRDSLTVEVMGDFFNTRLHTLDSWKISQNQKEHFIPASVDTTLYPEEILKKGDVYKIHRGRKRDSGLGDSGKYLELPGILEEAVKELAQSLKGDSDLDTLENIRSYLKNNYSYTLETEGRDDYLRNFLFEEKKGYCVHFASALLILARINGIPCRYVTGFLTWVPEPSDPGKMRQDVTFSVTGEESHAWVEVYTDKYQWMTWEVTPPQAESFLENRDFNSREQADLMALIREKGKKEFLSAETSKKTSWYLFWALVIPVLFILIRVFRKRRKKRSFKKLLKRIERQTVKGGWASPSLAGWLNWHDNFRLEKVKHAGELRRVRDIVLKGLYSDIPLRARDLEYLHIFLKKRVLSGIDKKVKTI